MSLGVVNDLISGKHGQVLLLLLKTMAKQGQGNQCQAPGVKFEELTGWKKGKNGKKWEETGRNGQTEEKTRPKVKTIAYFFLI